MMVVVVCWVQLFKTRITLFTMIAQANDSYTFISILYKFHMAISCFSYILHLLDRSLSGG